MQKAKAPKAKVDNLSDREHQRLAFSNSASHVDSHVSAADVEIELSNVRVPPARPRIYEAATEGAAHTSTAKDEELDVKYASFVKQQDRTHYINKTFWNQLDETNKTSDHILLDRSSRALGTVSGNDSSIHRNVELNSSSLFVFRGTQSSNTKAHQADLSDE